MNTGYDYLTTGLDTPRSSRCPSPIAGVPADQVTAKPGGETANKKDSDLRIAAKFIADGLQGKRTDDSNRATLCYLLDHNSKIIVQTYAFKNKDVNEKDLSGINAPEISVLKSNPVSQALATSRHDITTVHVITSSLTGAVGVLDALASFAAHYPALTVTLTFAKLTNLHRKDIRSHLWTLSNTTNAKVQVIGKTLLRHLVDEKEMTSQVLSHQGPPYNSYDLNKLEEVLEEQECLSGLQSQLSSHHKSVSHCLTLLFSNITRAKVPLSKVTSGLSKTFKSETTSGSSRNTIPNIVSLLRHVKKDWRVVSHLPKMDDSHRHLSMLINDVSETLQEIVTLQVIKQAFDDANILLLREVIGHGFICKSTYAQSLDGLKTSHQEVLHLIDRHKSVDERISDLDDEVNNLSRDSWQSEADAWCLNGIGLKVLTDLVLQSKALVNDLLGLHYQVQGAVITLHVLLSKLQLANKTQALNLHKQAGELIQETKVRNQVKGQVKTLEGILKQCAGSAQGQGHLLKMEDNEGQSDAPSERTSRRGSMSDVANDLDSNDSPKNKDFNELEDFTDEEVLRLTIRQYHKQTKSV